MTDPRARARFFPEVVLGQDIEATLGEPTPSQPPLLTSSPNPFYSYHPGDIMSPGAAAWVLDQKWETPLMCQWGNGLLLKPNRGFQPGISPLYANFQERAATPWGTALNPATTVPLYQTSLQAVQDGSLQPNPDQYFTSQSSDY